MRIKKKLLFTVIVIIVLKVLAPTYTVMATASQTESWPEQFLFLLSQQTLNAPPQDLIILFSHIRISNTSTKSATYRVLALFSELDISGHGEFQITTLSSTITYLHEHAISITPLWRIFDLFIKETNYQNQHVYSDIIPNLVLQAIFSLFTLLLCLIILPVQKSFFEQCSTAAIHEKIHVIQNGLVLYFIFLGLSAIFLLSVIGYPVSVLFFLIVCVFMLLGKIALGILLGNILMSKTQFQTNTYTNFIIGAIIVEGMTFIPYLQLAMHFLILPILAIGLIYTGLINGLVRKKYYYLENQQKHKATPSTQHVDRENLRKIILGEKNV